jgi:hypothetical protein
VCARLRILPTEAQRLQPTEILALADGDDENWSRMALLAQWVAWQIVMAIPTFSRDAASGKRKFEKFSDYCRKQSAPMLSMDMVEGKKRK